LLCSWDQSWGGGDGDGGWGMDHTKADVGNINIYQHGITKIVWELILYIKMELPAIGHGFLGDVTPVTNPFDLDEIAKHQLILSDLPGSPEACGNGKCPRNRNFTQKFIDESGIL
jgi:hypothetical protein